MPIRRIPKWRKTPLHVRIGYIGAALLLCASAIGVTMAGLYCWLRTLGT